MLQAGVEVSPAMKRRAISRGLGAPDHGRPRGEVGGNIARTRPLSSSKQGLVEIWRAPPLAIAFGR